MYLWICLFAHLLFPDERWILWVGLGLAVYFTLGGPMWKARGESK